MTGDRQTGKTTVLALLLEDRRHYGGILTKAIRIGPGIPVCILLQDLCNDKTWSVIGTRNTQGTGVDPVIEGFEETGAKILDRCLKSRNNLVVIDEIGFLESNAPQYCDKIRACLREKTVMAVVRKQRTPFLDELLQRPDVFLFDLDHHKEALAETNGCAGHP